MSNLRYNRLLLLSDTLRSARQLSFQIGINLITANDNSVGKSTVAKCIFWAFGCEPFFDSTFKGFDVKVIVDFSIDDKDFRIRRYKNDIRIKQSNSEYKTYTKITGEFSQYLAKLLNFKARLPTRVDDVVSVPPPAYYFVPYYIDQLKSWSNAWDNFENLGQYPKWKNTIIEYHIGILTDEYFEYSDVISEVSIGLTTTKENIKELESAYKVIEDQRPKSVGTIDEREFELMTDEISYKLKSIVSSQEDLLNKLADNQTELSYISSQLDISSKIIVELEKDYQFSVENILNDTFECPLCGVEHDNSVINRSSILADKLQASAQYGVLKKEHERRINIAARLQQQIGTIRSEIREINDKYQKQSDSELQIDLTDIVEQVASNTIQSRIEEKKAIQLFEEKSLKDNLHRLRKLRKETTSTQHREEIVESFNALMSKYISFFDAEGVNLSNINRPTDYNKIIKEGGAAEGIRGILSYYLSIYSLINMYSNEVVAPLVVDTPNQHEQSERNYDKIVAAFLDKKLGADQIIICAMDHSNLDPLKNAANIIRLDEEKLFLRREYSKVSSEFKI